MREQPPPLPPLIIREQTSYGTTPPPLILRERPPIPPARIPGETGEKEKFKLHGLDVFRHFIS